MPVYRELKRKEYKKQTRSLKIKSKKEGTTHASVVATRDVPKNNIIKIPDPVQEIMDTHICIRDQNFVFFYFETTGFGKFNLIFKRYK